MVYILNITTGQQLLLGGCLLHLFGLRYGLHLASARMQRRLWHLRLQHLLLQWGSAVTAERERYASERVYQE